VVTLTNYGAKIVSVYAPDRNGNFADVILGFKSYANLAITMNCAKIQTILA
jgi:aldose 1-epimerase